MTDEAMTAPQLNAVAKYQEQLTRRILTDIELRKLALDQTCRLLEKYPARATDEQAIGLAKAMYGFLTEPAKEASKVSDKG